MIRKLFKWVFKSELDRLNAQIEETKKQTQNYKNYQSLLNNLLQNIDVSVDVHEYHRHARSWAVISLQGTKTDYIKFVDLYDSDILEIQRFLRNFERGNHNIKIDASPQASAYLRVRRK